VRWAGVVDLFEWDGWGVRLGVGRMVRSMGDWILAFRKCIEAWTDAARAVHRAADAQEEAAEATRDLNMAATRVMQANEDMARTGLRSHIASAEANELQLAHLRADIARRTSEENG
jgi:Sec-independent protein translocase protein TatA